MQRSASKTSMARKKLFLALDFDGTLLKGRAGQVTPDDLAALRSLRKRTHEDPNFYALIVLASGRNLLSLCRTLKVPSKHHALTASCQPWWFGEQEGTTANDKKTAHDNNDASAAAAAAAEAALPVDYVVLGSGALTIKWPSQEIIQKQAMSPSLAFDICYKLRLLGYSFFVMRAPPFMEQTFYHVNKSNVDDGDDVGGGAKLSSAPNFAERLNTYRNSGGKPLDLLVGASEENESNSSSDARQKFIELHNDGFAEILVVFESREDDADKIIHADAAVCEAAAAGHNEGAVRITHTTSPVHSTAVWLEVFPSSISKSKALQQIEDECFRRKDEEEHAKAVVDTAADNNNSSDDDVALVKRVSVGNDHNDEDMLQWAAAARPHGVGAVVAGSPPALIDRNKEWMQVLNEPCGGGVAEAVRKFCECS